MTPDAATLLTLFAQQSSENALVLFDRESRIVWASPACFRLFGYSAEDLIGKPAPFLFTSDDVNIGVPGYEFGVAARSEDVNNDRWMQRADGTRFWATGNTTGILDSNGSVIGYGKVLRDSTDVKEQLESMANRIRNLSDMSGKKDQFLAQLSHELRNPLGALSNAVAAIQMRSDLDPVIEQTVQLIARQGEFLRGLANQLLELTRINSGKVQLELARVDLRVPIARAIESTQAAISERGQTLNQHILDVPMIVMADETRLEQVFVNLLTNASKYTPPGGQIELRASINASEVWVHVIDNGIGIAPELLPHVFELFTRGDDAAVHAADGLGIGLSLVKEFVQLHGGSIQVRSDGAGEGSEFTLRLPLADATPAREEVGGAKRGHAQNADSTAN